MTGHLFIINGDLTKIACDAILIPTDTEFSIGKQWHAVTRRVGEEEHWAGKKVVLQSDEQVPHCWLGQAGQVGNDSDFTPFQTVLEEFVPAALERLQGVDDSARTYPWQKRRLAVNVLGSGRGGGSDRKGDLTMAIVKSLESLAGRHDVDLILVTFGEKAYAAAQRARGGVVDRDDLAATWRFDADANTELIDKANALANHAIESQLVLFIGAGVSAGAGLPMWDELLGLLAVDDVSAAELPSFNRKDPRDRATILQARLSPPDSRLKSLVADEISKRKRYALAHGLLASLPSREAVTTNFDELFELAANIDGRKLSVLPERPGNSNWLLKLHGTVEASERMVLTRHDFLNIPRQDGALIGLVQGLLMMRHMMFVGYSMSDEDFHELVHEVRLARTGTTHKVGGTVLSLWADDLVKELWAKDLDVVSMMNGPEPEPAPESKSLTELSAKERWSVASRQLEMFLDLVGFLSATSAAFFLDDTYSKLTRDETPLRDALVELRRITAGKDDNTVASLVHKFLETLGTNPSQ